MTDAFPDPTEPADPDLDRLPEDVADAFYEAMVDAPADQAPVRLAALQGQFPAHREQLQVAADRLNAGGAAMPDLVQVGAMPEWIGPYRVLSKLGEGGFGVVYLAEQQGELSREVAVKCLLPGMDSRQVLARFETERQALAKMSHPVIAQVFDVGMSDLGRPYFVMEHVAGLPVTDYCQSRDLGVTARLRLFGAICDGVHHAHQKGVIHRDLKPSNILVANENGRPLPKVIDFGIAKSLHRTDGPKSQFTEVGRLLGTLEYMSPEQAAGRAFEVDTRSDVYSLGVVLYELLTGLLPFDLGGARNRNPTELQRLMLHQDPMRPSQRLSRSRRRSTGATTARGEPSTGGRTLVSADELRGDLDWIVMRALEKDPSRRYESAFELRMDLERFLDHEPVRAHPPRRSYLLRKFVRRHRASVLAGTFVAAALIGGLVTTSVYYVDAKKNLQQFEQLADLVLLSDLIEEEPKLWPEHPDRVSAMESWLERARALTGRQAGHEESRAEVAARGQAVAPLSRAPAADGEALASALESASASSASSTSSAPDSDSTPESTPASSDPSGSPAPALRFTDSRDRFLYASLGRLLTRLKTLNGPDGGLVQRVEKRLEVSRVIERQTVADHATAWARARKAVREDPRFGGLDLQPQVGLIPLGPDPKSGLQEFAHLRSGQPVTRNPAGQLAFGPKSGLVLVLIPGGTCAVGSQAEEAAKPNFDLDSGINERPVVSITLEPFFLSKFEMTQGQWRFVTDECPARINPRGAQPYLGQFVNWDHPVEHVEWQEADFVCGCVGMVLPTEAQWEYACRAGTTTPFYTGANLASLQGHANVMDKTAAPHFGKNRDRGAFHADFDDGFAGHAPVQSFLPNPFGLVAMHGNINEMTADWATSYGSAEARPGDGLRGGEVQRQPLRVTRGGSYFQLIRAARSSNRTGLDPNSRDFVSGLRPARRIQ